MNQLWRSGAAATRLRSLSSRRQASPRDSTFSVLQTRLFLLQQQHSYVPWLPGFIYTNILNNIRQTDKKDATQIWIFFWFTASIIPTWHFRASTLAVSHTCAHTHTHTHTHHARVQQNKLQIAGAKQVMKRAKPQQKPTHSRHQVHSHLRVQDWAFFLKAVGKPCLVNVLFVVVAVTEEG